MTAAPSAQFIRTMQILVVEIVDILMAFPRLTSVSFLQRLKDEIAEVTSEIENLGSTEER